MRDAARRREATKINTKCDALLAVHNVRSSVQRRAAMKGMIAAMLALAASGYAAGVAQERPDGEAMLARFATLPPEARALAERLVLCGHFGCELNGDGGERDREVHARMGRLGCDKVDVEVAAARKKYAWNRKVMQALAEAGGG